MGSSQPDSIAIVTRANRGLGLEVGQQFAK